MAARLLVALGCCTIIAWGALAEPVEKPGERFEIKVEDLPPISTERAVNFPRTQPRGPDDHLLLPEGFKIDVFATGLASPRWLAVAPNGDVFVAVPASRFAKVGTPNTIWLLKDTDGDHKADEQHLFADGFDMPMGLEVLDGVVLVSDVKGVWRLPYDEGANQAGSRERLTAEGALGLKAGSHYHRILALGPNDENMFVAVGSATNVNEDPLPHASVQKFSREGSEQSTFASGLRNPIGLAFHPDTDELYTVVNERDGYGDDLVPDYFTRLEQGDFFGWPYAYTGGIEDPKYAGQQPDLVQATKMPDVLFQAHSAPVGLVFYKGGQFPEEYIGDAFVSLHGSWNRSEPTGYKVVRIRFEEGRPVGGYENFLTGFLRTSEDGHRIVGRPAGLAQLPDGSLLLAEDGNNIIYRISYDSE